jgi:hypothetical protein
VGETRVFLLQGIRTSESTHMESEDAVGNRPSGIRTPESTLMESEDAVGNQPLGGFGAGARKFALPAGQ